MLKRTLQILASLAAIAAAFPMMLFLAVMIGVWPLWTAGFSAIGVLVCFLITAGGAWGFVSAFDPNWKPGETETRAPPAPKKSQPQKGVKR